MNYEYSGVEEKMNKNAKSKVFNVISSSGGGQARYAEQYAPLAGN